ncbi:AraC family transcriptional regulator [Myroides odoratus]|uniref:AraC family transcriptional regulator n=1 Tax=Myroides odoratus TaxID=256 RepID=UPI0033414AAC
MSLAFTLDDLYQLYEANHPQHVQGMIIVNQVYQVMDEDVDYRQQFDGLILSFMTQGHMDIRIQTASYRINKGDIAIILPHVIIEPLAASTDSTMTTIGLSLDFLSNFPVLLQLIHNNTLRNHPLIQLNDEDTSVFTELLHLLQSVYVRNNVSKTTETLHYLTLALISFVLEAYAPMNQTNPKPISRSSAIIHEFYQLVFQQATLHRSAKFYAEQLHLTPQYLTTLLKAETGKSILEWVTFFVMIQAKALLNTTNLSIKEISHELHFTDTSLFCRYFKRNTGISPEKYRVQTGLPTHLTARKSS